MLHEKLKIIDKSGKTSSLKIDQSRLKFIGSDGIPQWVLLSKQDGILSIDKDIQIGNVLITKETSANEPNGYLQIKESDTSWVYFKAAGMFIHGDMELQGNLGSENGQNGDLYVSNLHAKAITCSGALEVPESITANTIKTNSSIQADSSIQAGGDITSTGGSITASSGTISASGSISANTITSSSLSAYGNINLGAIYSTNGDITSSVISGTNINLGTVSARGGINVTLRPSAEAAVVQYNYKKLNALITGYTDSSRSYMRSFFRNVTDLDLYFLLDTSSIKGMEREFDNNAEVPDGYFLLTRVLFNNSWIKISNVTISNKNAPRSDRDPYILLGSYDGYNITITRENKFEWGDWSPISKIKGITFNITTTTTYQQ